MGATQGVEIGGGAGGAGGAGGDTVGKKGLKVFDFHLN